VSFNELRALVDTDPVTAVQLAREDDFSRRYRLGFLASLPDEQLDAILGRKRTWVPYAALPPSGKEWAQQMLARLQRAPEALDAASADEPGARSSTRPEEFAVEFIVRYRPDGASSFMAWLWCPDGSSGYILESAPRLNGGTARGLGSLSDTADRLGLTQDQLLDRLKKTEAGRKMISGEEARQKGIWEERTLKGGIKATRLELEDGDQHSLAEVLTRLHDLPDFRDLEFVADSYLAKPGGLRPLDTAPRPRPNPKAPVMIGAYVPKDPDKMLDHLAECFGRKWTRDGGIVRFRSPDWMEDLLDDPPAWLMDRIRQRGAENGRLDFSDMLLLAQTLTDDQMARLTNVRNTPFSDSMYWASELQQAADLLRLYAGLAADCQAAVFRGGISGRAMTPEQASRFAAYVQDKFDGQPTTSEAVDAVLSGRTKVTPRSIDPGPETIQVVDLTIALPSGEERVVRVVLPPAEKANRAKP
jgi:hypothetical protein